MLFKTKNIVSLSAYLKFFILGLLLSVILQSVVWSYPIHDHFGEVLYLYVVLVNQLAIVNYFIDLLFSHPLAHCHHSMLEISYGNFAVVIRIENLKGIYEILEALFVLTALLNNLLKCFEGKTTGSLWVNFLLHLNDFGLSWVKIESSDKRTEFTCGDLAPIALIKQCENLFDFVC